MADFDTAEFRAARFTRSAADQIAEHSFPVVMRGYDRAAVDAFVEKVVQVVQDLESRQSQESVVQRALAEVGEETTSILQRAHETADEIAARSRAQAEGRIQRAEREAELVRRQADAYSEQIVVDTRRLWEERQQLIEDIRQLADDVLNTAEDALERVTMPQMLSDEAQEDPTDTTVSENGPPTEPVELPPPDVELDVLEGGAAAEDDDRDDDTV
jgi:cell division initiation protein